MFDVTSNTGSSGLSLTRRGGHFAYLSNGYASAYARATRWDRAGPGGTRPYRWNGSNSDVTLPVVRLAGEPAALMVDTGSRLTHLHTGGPGKVRLIPTAHRQQPLADSGVVWCGVVCSWSGAARDGTGRSTWENRAVPQGSLAIFLLRAFAELDTVYHSIQQWGFMAVTLARLELLECFYAQYYLTLHGQSVSVKPLRMPNLALRGTLSKVPRLSGPGNLYLGSSEKDGSWWDSTPCTR